VVASELDIHFYRAVQEGIATILKHTHANDGAPGVLSMAFSWRRIEHDLTPCALSSKPGYSAYILVVDKPMQRILRPGRTITRSTSGRLSRGS
jgi:hypothetical protein